MRRCTCRALLIASHSNHSCPQTTFNSFLYLAALRAAERIGIHLGNSSFTEAARCTAEQGSSGHADAVFCSHARVAMSPHALPMLCPPDSALLCSDACWPQGKGRGRAAVPQQGSVERDTPILPGMAGCKAWRPAVGHGRHTLRAGQLAQHFSLWAHCACLLTLPLSTTASRTGRSLRTRSGSPRTTLASQQLRPGWFRQIVLTHGFCEHLFSRRQRLRAAVVSVGRECRTSLYLHRILGQVRSGS